MEDIYFNIISECFYFWWWLCNCYVDEKTKVDEEDVLDYILHLDDMEYLKLIAKTSNRVVEEMMI